MHFIDKSRLRCAFDDYTRDYLHASHCPKEHRFIPKLADDEAYTAFSNKRWKYSRLQPQSPFNGWLQILLDETNGRCCYCMRRLEGNEVSVEHLIPENFTNLAEDEEISFYEHYAPYLQKRVMTGLRFDELASKDLIDIDSVERMPHLIAHANLFPACEAKYGCCCNNHRGNNRILPIMLMADNADWIKYAADGKVLIIHPDVDASSSTLEHLDLNTPTLIAIRRLWYLCSLKGIFPNQKKDYSVKERDAILRQALDLDDIDIIPDEFRIFLREADDSDKDYWHLFIKYDWFYTRK